VVAREKGFADGERLKAALTDRLARFKQPRAILFTDSLPKNAMGKVQKAALRDAYRALFS